MQKNITRKSINVEMKRGHFDTFLLYIDIYTGSVVVFLLIV